MAEPTPGACRVIRVGNGDGLLELYDDEERLAAVRASAPEDTFLDAASDSDHDEEALARIRKILADSRGADDAVLAAEMRHLLASIGREPSSQRASTRLSSIVSPVRAAGDGDDTDPDGIRICKLLGRC
jgi:hypothetical protein